MRLVIFVLCIVAAACERHAVRCDAHLQPINVPAPKQAGLPTSGPSRP